MNRLVPIAIVLLTLVAGCTGTTGPSDSTSAATATNATATDSTTNGTTAGSTTANATTANATRPAWVAANGRVNVQALVDANKKQLQSRGFDLATEFRSTGNHPTLIKRRSRASANFERFRSRVVQTRNGSQTVQHLWVNETMTRALIRNTSEDGTHYRFRSVGSHTHLRRIWLSWYYGQRRLSGLLADATLTVNGTSAVNGTRRYTLVGSNISGYHVRNATLTLTVSADGAIRRMNESGTFTTGGEFAYHYRAHPGVDTVKRPDWVASTPPKASLTNSSNSTPE